MSKKTKHSKIDTNTNENQLSIDVFLPQENRNLNTFESEISELKRTLTRFVIKNDERSISEEKSKNTFKNWKFIHEIAYQHKMKKMIFGNVNLMNQIFSKINLTGESKIVGKNYNRERFLEIIETLNSEVVVFISKKYYRFTDIGIACKILGDNIEVSVVKDYLLLKNQENFLLIKKID